MEASASDVVCGIWSTLACQAHAAKNGSISNATTQEREEAAKPTPSTFHVPLPWTDLSYRREALRNGGLVRNITSEHEPSAAPGDLDELLQPVAGPSRSPLRAYAAQDPDPLPIFQPVFGAAPFSDGISGALGSSSISPYALSNTTPGQPESMVRKQNMDMSEILDPDGERALSRSGEGSSGAMGVWIGAEGDWEQRRMFEDPSESRFAR